MNSFAPRARTLLLLAALALPGCASPLRDSSPRPTAIDRAPTHAPADASPPITLQILSETPIVDGESVPWPDAGDEATSAPRQTEHADTRDPSRRWLTARLPAADPAALTWRVVKAEATRRDSGQLAPRPSTRQVLDFKRQPAPDGSWVATLVRTTEAEDQVTTFFQPSGMIVARSALPGADETTDQFEMVVRPSDRLDEVQTRGPASRSLRAVSRATVRVPAGQFQTLRLASTLRATLGQARVLTTTESFLGAGPDAPAGLVAERERLTVKVLGLTIRDKQREWVLVRTAPAGIADALLADLPADPPAPSPPSAPSSASPI